MKSTKDVFSVQESVALLTHVTHHGPWVMFSESEPDNHLQEDALIRQPESHRTEQLLKIDPWEPLPIPSNITYEHGYTVNVINGYDFSKTSSTIPNRRTDNAMAKRKRTNNNLQSTNN